MALNQVTEHIWLGSLMSLAAERTLTENRVTHVLSVLGNDPINNDSSLWTKSPVISKMKQHMIVDIEDVDETNIMQHFAKCNDFIQKAIDSGEGVLVHCAAGISRSVTCVCAYLMKTNKWTPEIAIEYVRSKRPVANPNDGFRRQLTIYYESGYMISDDSKLYREWKLQQAPGKLVSQKFPEPSYTQVRAPPLTVAWKHIIPALLKKSGSTQADPREYYNVIVDGIILGSTEPIADALKNSMPSSVKLVSKDHQQDIDPGLLGDVIKQVITRMVSFRCKGCSSTVASSSSIVRHETGSQGACQHYFVEPIEWMRPELEKGVLEGKLFCPNCSKKIGSYLWQGSKCSCGSWVTPSFKLSKAKVDEMATTARPLL